MRTALLGGLWLVPILVGLFVTLRVVHRTLARAIGITVAALLVPLALVIFVSSEAELLTASSAGFPVRELTGDALAVDGLSAVLVPLVTGLSLAVLIASPKADLDRYSVMSLLVAEGATLGVLVSANVLLLAAFWSLSLLPLASEARRSKDIALVRATRWAAVLCILPMIAAVCILVGLAARAGVRSPFDLRAIAESGIARRWSGILAPLLVLACTARMGIFPFHLWVPVAFARGRLAIVLPAIVSPLGSFVFVRLALGLVPDAIRSFCPVLMGMATVSSLYGALLAVGQNHARRQLGYLWTSVAGFVLAGVATLDPQGLSGALVHDLGLTIAMSGLALTVRSVEARTGTSDFRRLGGLVQRAPGMATGYFLLGAAAVGFPATVTFVSEDLVAQGLIGRWPVVALLLLTATAINGVTLVRSFKRIFLGPPSRHAEDLGGVEDFLPRERRVAIALVLALLAGGFVPTPLLAIRRQVESVVRPDARPPPLEEGPDAVDGAPRNGHKAE